MKVRSKPIRNKLFALIGGLGFAMMGTAGFAEDRLFAIAGKSIDDPNFVLAHQACARAAAENGDRCILIGSSGAAHFRDQDIAVRRALDRDLDALALSATNPEYLAERSLEAVRAQGVPIVAFASGMGEEYAHLVEGYVGPDNLALGRKLGRLVRRYRPDGGVLCLMSAGRFNINLNRRLAGVREALSGRLDTDAGERLRGENGWKEPRRCPWFNRDDRDSALAQLRHSLKDSEVDTFVAVGGRALSDVKRYRSVVQPFREGQTSSPETLLLFVTGTPTEERMALLREGLVDAYVSVDFQAIGRAVYQRMKTLADGGTIPEHTYIAPRVWLPEAITEQDR